MSIKLLEYQNSRKKMYEGLKEELNKGLRFDEKVLQELSQIKEPEIEILPEMKILSDLDDAIALSLPCKFKDLELRCFAAIASGKSRLSEGFFLRKRK